MVIHYQCFLEKSQCLWVLVVFRSSEYFVLISSASACAFAIAVVFAVVAAFTTLTDSVPWVLLLLSLWLMPKAVVTHTCCKAWMLFFLLRMLLLWVSFNRTQKHEKPKNLKTRKHENPEKHKGRKTEKQKNRKTEFHPTTVRSCWIFHLLCSCWWWQHPVGNLFWSR